MIFVLSLTLKSGAISTVNNNNSQLRRRKQFPKQGPVTFDRFLLQEVFSSHLSV